MKSLLKPLVATLALALLPAASMCPPTREREVCERTCELMQKERPGYTECWNHGADCEKDLLRERERFGAAAYEQWVECALQAGSLDALDKCLEILAASMVAGTGSDGSTSGQASKAGRAEVFSPLLGSLRAPVNPPAAAPLSANPAATGSPAASAVVASPPGADPPAADPIAADSAAGPAGDGPPASPQPARPLPSRRPEIPLAKPGAG